MTWRLAPLLLVAACGHFDFDRAHDAGLRDGDGTGDDAMSTLDGSRDGSNTMTLADGLLVHFAFDTATLTQESISDMNATCGPCPIAGLAPGSLSAASFMQGACVHMPVLDTLTAHQDVFTFAAWARSALEPSATVFGVTLNGGGPDANLFKLYLDASTATYRVSTAYSESFVSGGVPPNTWHHIAGVYTGSTLFMYLDGIAIGSIPGMGMPSPLSPTDNITVGCDHDAGNVVETFNGLLADVRLYGRALTEAELDLLVALGSMP